eukprot:4543260-Amphidinium_carterae.1
MRVSALGDVGVNRRGTRSLDFQVMACSLTTQTATDSYIVATIVTSDKSVLLRIYCFESQFRSNPRKLHDLRRHV